MTKEFEKLIEELKNKKTSFFALSDFNVLGEDLFIIKGIGDQLTLYSDIVNTSSAGKENDFIHISADTLWGIGQMIWRLTTQLDEKIKMIDENFDIKVRKDLE